jgi:hypothetical protein
MKTPNTKIRNPKKLQAPGFKESGGYGAGLMLGLWSLSGVWCLELGVSAGGGR